MNVFSQCVVCHRVGSGRLVRHLARDKKTRNVSTDSFGIVGLSADFRDGVTSECNQQQWIK